MLLVLLVVWFGLCLLLAAAALFLQNYFNERPVSVQDISWRAPAAGTLVAVFMSFWCLLATGNPDRWAALTEFSPRQDLASYDEMKLVFGKETRTFVKRKDERGRTIYRDRQTNTPLTAQPDRVIVVESGAEAVFTPELDSKGKRKIEYGGRLRYKDEKGRIMEDGFLGQVTVVRTGWTITYIVLNLVHGGIWFVALWPLMRFSVGQSILLGIGAWVTSTLVVMPPLLNQARIVHDRGVKEQKQNEPSEKKAARTRPGNENEREDLAILPLISGVKSTSPQESGGRLVQSGRRTPAGHLEATAAGNSTLTLTSWPAVTLTRSSRISPLNSALIV